MTVREHALLGGSSAHRWSVCTASAVLGKNIPDEEASEAALEGTEAHRIAEFMLKGWLDYYESGQIDYKVLDFNPKIETFIPEMTEAAKGYSKSVYEKVLENSITGKAYGIEELLTLDEKLQMFGYVDFWCVYIDDHGKRVGAIVDFKYGYHEVEVDKNAQLAFYACALREEIRRGGKDLDYVRAVIYQPKSDEPYKETKFTGKQLETWKKKYFKAAEDIYLNQKPKFKLGSHCTFCKARGVCTVYAKSQEDKTGLMLLDPQQISLPEVECLSDGAIAKIVLHKNELEDFLEQCKKYAYKRAQDGKPIEGTKLVAGTSKRKWDEDEAGIANTLSLYGIAHPYNKKLKGIIEIEKELKAKGQSKELLDSLCTLTPSLPILVSADDSRPGIASGVDLLVQTENNKE